MNRREAIAALVSLPEVTRISAAPVKPGDVIVIECEGRMSMETAERIKTHLQPIWPGHKIVVLSDGLKLKVVSE